MPSLITTDAIKIQLQSLVPCANYKATFKLHNPTSELAYLDTEELRFIANSDKQNVFIVMTKSPSITALILEVTTVNLDNNLSASTTMFLQCPEYDACGLNESS